MQDTILILNHTLNSFINTWYLYNDFDLYGIVFECDWQGLFFQ